MQVVGWLGASPNWDLGAGRVDAVRGVASPTGRELADSSSDQPFLSQEKVLLCSWEVSLALTGQSGWEGVASVTAHLGLPFLFFFLPLEQRPGSIYQIGLAPLL